MISVFNSEILNIKNLNGNVKILRLSVPENFVFKAGQYVSVSIPFEGKRLRRPYSIASPSGKNSFIELCIKLIDSGVASNYIKTLTKGGKVELLGSAGKFIFEESSKNKDVAFVSAGTGVTPFVSMIPILLENKFKNKIILLKGFRNEENILYEKEFSELSRRYSNFKFHNVLSRPKQDFENKGHVQDFLKKFLQEKDCDVYICGLSPMINAVKEKSLELGIPENRIFFERYD